MEVRSIPDQTKIGFIGNSCTGKTTSCFNLVKKLKFLKAKTGYCNDICRVPFSPEKFDTIEWARLHVLYKQMSTEMEHMIRDDVDYLICERTSLDWIAYYNASFDPLDGKFDLEDLAGVDEHVLPGYTWMDTYHVLFYMHPMGEYYDDGHRPSATHIRDKVQPEYESILKYIKQNYNGTLIEIFSDNVIERTAEVEERFEKWFYGFDYSEKIMLNGGE